MSHTPTWSTYARHPPGCCLPGLLSVQAGSSYVFDTVYTNGFVRIAAEHCSVSGARVEACSSRGLELTGGRFLPVVRLAAGAKPEYGAYCCCSPDACSRLAACVGAFVERGSGRSKAKLA